jgi:hypothetical protein
MVAHVNRAISLISAQNAERPCQAIFMLPSTPAQMANPSTPPMAGLA